MGYVSISSFDSSVGIPVSTASYAGKMNILAVTAGISINQ